MVVVQHLTDMGHETNFTSVYGVGENGIGNMLGLLSGSPIHYKGSEEKTNFLKVSEHGVRPMSWANGGKI